MIQSLDAKSKVIALCVAAVSGLLISGVVIGLLEKDLGFFPMLFGFGSLFFYTAFCFGSLSYTLQQNLSKWYQESTYNIFKVSALINAVYWAYAIGTWSFGFDRLLIVMIYSFGPAMLVYGHRESEKFYFRDLLFILLIWLPVDMALIQMSWPWPLGLGKNAYSIPIGVSMVMVFGVAYRGLTPIRFAVPAKLDDYKFIFKNLFVFLAIAIPFGFITGFIGFHPRDLTFLSFLGSILATFLLVALPEEVLFRGLMQNYIEKFFKSSNTGLILTSIIFGFSHLNNTPSPDWRYIFIASVAGLFYGIVFRRTGNLISSMIVHTGVDVIWISFFYK